MNTFSLSKISWSWLPVVLKSTMVFPLAAQTSDWYVFILFISIVCIVLINMLCTSIPLPGRIYNTSIWCILWCSFADFFPILQDSPIPSNPRWATKASPRCIAEPPRPGCQQNSAAFALCRESRVEIWWSQRSQTTSHLTRNVFKIFFSCLEKLLQSDFYNLEISLLEIKCWIPGSKALHTNIYRLFWPGDEMENGLSYKTILYIILSNASNRPAKDPWSVEFAWICE